MPAVLKTVKNWMLLHDDYDPQDDYSTPSHFIIKVEKIWPGFMTISVAKCNNEVGVKGLLMREEGVDEDGRPFVRIVVLARIETGYDIEKLMRFINKEDEFQAAEEFIRLMEEDSIVPVVRYKIEGATEGFFRVMVWD